MLAEADIKLRYIALPLASGADVTRGVQLGDAAK